jgi:hypothetical protein
MTNSTNRVEIITSVQRVVAPERPDTVRVLRELR